jgi:hypothetical protein
MNQLEPCPHCHRHVTIHEAACPFCTGSLAAFANLPPRLAPRIRLGRAAVFAFGVAALAQACGDNLPPSPPQHDARIPPDAARDAGVDADNADNDGSVAIYCAAPTDDGGPRERS